MCIICGKHVQILLVVLPYNNINALKTTSNSQTDKTKSLELISKEIVGSGVEKLDRVNC